MEKTYTQEKLIQLIYGECDILERLEVLDAVENNTFLKDSYLSLLDAYSMLPKVKFSPSSMITGKIVAYSNWKCEANY